MAATGESKSRATREWRIVPRTVNQHGDKVYDVFHGADRRVWGLKDEATARRWMKRLALGAPPVLLEPERTEDTDDLDDLEAADEAADDAPRRVWWNEA